MRISTSMMMDSYAKTLDAKYESINKYSNQVSTTMAFERPSDDPVAAMRSIKACHEYTLNQQYQTSEQTAASWMATTESTATEINNTLTSVQEKATEAANGTNNSSDMDNFVVAMKNYRSEIVSELNSTYNGQYVFGGSTSGSTPFRLGTAADDPPEDVDKLMYCTDNKTGTYTAVRDLTSAPTAAMTMKVDLGMDSPFEASISGLDAIVQSYSPGTDNNIVDQLTTAINASSASGYSTLLTGVSGAQDAVSNLKTDIGEKSSMLTAISARLTDSETNITSALANSMEVDSTKAIMNYNTSETIYKESLSISSTVLQNSIFDFLK